MRQNDEQADITIMTAILPVDSHRKLMNRTAGFSPLASKNFGLGDIVDLDQCEVFMTTTTKLSYRYYKTNVAVMAAPRP